MHPSGSEILSVSLITTAANKTVGKIHHRMPVILPEPAWDAWLSTSNVRPSMDPFLAALHRDAFLGSHPVSRLVNKTDTDSAELIARQSDLETSIGQMDLFSE